MRPTLPSRRQLLQGAGILAFVSAPRGWAATGAAADLPQLATQAAIWGLPLVETGRYLALAKAKGTRINQLYLNQALATPSLKIAGPNVDTIYGYAWLDLSDGPIVLDVPDAGGRYYSIQFIDAYENTFAYVGHRATGGKAGSFLISGPGWQGHAASNFGHIAAPTNLVFLLTRTLVKNPGDLPAAQALQSAYALTPLTAYGAGRITGIVEQNALRILPVLDLAGDAAAFFGELNSLVRQYPPLGSEQVAFRALQPLGLGSAPSWRPALSQSQLQQAFDTALARVRAADTSVSNSGWRVNYQITPFIADPLARAANNKFGPGAHVAAEALYFFAAKDDQGKQLTGARNYSITFPKGQLPPVKAFWSLCLYDADFHLIENRINRYAITNHTDGLVYEPDGGLKIVISQEAAPARGANWLPAPEGGFQLLLRAYEPDQALLSRTYVMPSIVAL